MDRYAVNEAYNLSTQFAKYMWVTYRKKSGATWTPANPVDKYSQGQLDYSNCEYHCTRMDGMLTQRTLILNLYNRVFNTQGEPVNTDVHGVSTGVYVEINKNGEMQKTIRGIQQWQQKWK